LTQTSHDEKVFIMKRLLFIVILTFNFNSFTNANDIKNFEIEGMSIGDSSLDYFSKKFINKQLESKFTYFYKDKKFAIINTNLQSTKYERISLTIKPNDKEFTIHGIKGSINFENRLQECLTLRDKIAKNIQNLFKDLNIINNEGKHGFDKTGESLFYAKEFEFSNGAEVRIYCMNWSKKIEEMNNYKDQLNVLLNSKEMMKFLSNDPF